MTIPSSTTPGSYWIGMMADRTSAVLELNEGNNTVSTAINATRALIEREARLGMKKRDIESIPLYPEGRSCKAPTADGILSSFLALRRTRLIKPGGAIVKTFHDPLRPVGAQLLKLLGVDRQAFGR